VSRVDSPIAMQWIDKDGRPTQYFFRLINDLWKRIGGSTDDEFVDSYISALGAPSGANKFIYSTSATAFIYGDITAFARTLLDDANEAAFKATTNLEIGIDVQAYDAGLASIAGLTTAADSMIYTTALDTYAVATLTAFARTLLNDAAAANARDTLELGSSNTPSFAGVAASGATGVGYGAGAGGEVTQNTSRTTGVTLDKVTGVITLVSAAGTASWQSFTVTNSTVAATDTILINQKSGTDLYMLFVTAVAAGSFRITFATTGGTTTEQPLFNFTVIKGVIV